MKRRLLIALGLALLPAIAAAQLLPSPPAPVIPPPPPPVIIPPTPPDTTKIDPALLPLVNLIGRVPVIVEMLHPVAPFVCPPTIGLNLRPNVCRAKEALIALGSLGDDAIPIAGLALINAAAGFANAAGISALSLHPAVAFIHYDRAVGPHQTAVESPPTPPGEFAPRYSRTVRAHPLWDLGITGNGITVAVLDSGVALDLDLTDRVLTSVNFADEALTSDPGGHGTHVAGIVAGNGTRSGGEFVGVAPQANIVDVRVLDRYGSGRTSWVVRGIEWVLEHRGPPNNIRVINLSFGARAPLSYRVDPLSAAVEIAWRRGLVVVAAAGNTGLERNTVLSPGIDPYVITVGATDSHGTRNPNDDTLARFTAWGDADSNPKPDLVAPGRRLASVRVPFSTLDTADRVVLAPNGSTYLRLTGTSQSTGVVSGVAALVLQSQPNLTPDQVKAFLVARTQPYGWETGPVLPDPIADGSGMADAQDAAKAAMHGDSVPAVNRGVRPSDAFARAMYPVLYGREDVLSNGAPFNWQSVAWDSVAWDSIAWDSIAWDTVVWDSVAWDSMDWSSVAWDSVAWDSVAWDTYTLD